MGEQRSAILLFSGGMDSYIAWYYLNKPATLYCDLGHRYAAIERKKIARCTESIGLNCQIETRLNLSDWEEADANIPMRNLFLCSIAAKNPKTTLIWLVCQKGETYMPDRTLDFMNAMSSVLTLTNSRDISVRSPFLGKTKMDAVTWYLETQKLEDPVGFFLMSNTIGCYNPTSDIKHCGQCAACFRRFVAFKYNQIDNSSEYDKDILSWDGTELYYKKFLKMFASKEWSQYGKKRVEQTLEVLRAVLS